MEKTKEKKRYAVSVGLPKDLYEKIRILAEKDMRPIGVFVAILVMKAMGKTIGGQNATEKT